MARVRLPVGQHLGLGPLGTSDMAGNVKEWCSTASGDRRFIPGGGWNEASYMFTDLDAQAPIERAPTYGFRCVKYIKPPPAAALAAIDQRTRDFTQETAGQRPGVRGHAADVRVRSASTQ